MNRTCFIVLTLCTLARVDVALATPPSDETRACVAASTQGQTERDEGHLLAAREQLLSCARDSCPVIVKKSCADWLAELDQRTPSVIVRVFETGHGDVTEASVSIDRQPVALDGRAVLLDPGPHTIAVVAPGSLPIARTFLIAEGERARVLSVQLPRRAPSPAEVPAVALSEPIAASTPTQAPRSTPPEPPHFSVPVGSWVLAGVGVAGLISFAVLGTQAKNELHELEHSCAPDCTQPQRDPAEQKARLADVSLGVGAAALVGAGAWMLGSWLRHERKHEAVLSLAPTHSGVLATLAARY